MDSALWSIMMMFSIIVFIGCLSRLYRQYRLRHYEVPAPDIRKGHRWFMVDTFPEHTYCNVGHFHIIHGAQCESCGVRVDDHNMKEANKKLPCKPPCSKEEVMQHHWVQCNLPLCSKCDVCDEDCGMLSQLSDLRCCWCRRIVHDHCASRTNLCDLGKYRAEIVPPTCIELKWSGLRGRKHLIVKSVRKPSIPHWSPLVVLANRKSGNNDGEHLLKAFRSILNPTQVIDLHDIPPENCLEWCHLVADVKVRVLVCGGDGTIGWVLDAIDKLKLENPPQVCILPLGTGNDLSRVLGWGEGYTGDVEVTEVLDRLEQSKPVNLDRWKINIVHEKHLLISRPSKMLIMNNYVSLGVDALVTLNFHKRRESTPWLFGNRFINKLFYFSYGTKDVLERECKHLHKKLKVELDGEEISLPEIEGLVVLNIASWGGGCRPWQLANDDNSHFRPARHDDGLLEVMALYSSFHIAQLQCGLASPVRLGQASKVKITLFGGNAPMQVDGEPWEQHPAEITITHHSVVSMLAGGHLNGFLNNHHD